MKSIRLLIIYLVATLALTAADDVRKVIVRPGVVFREKPELTGKSLGTIFYGKSVTLLKSDGPAASALGVQSHWAQIRFENRIGWVFGAFIGKDEDNISYEIIENNAYKRDGKKCLDLNKRLFPKYFTGGCLKQDCSQGCGIFQLLDNGTIHRVDACDGAPSKGKWQRVKDHVVIVETMIPWDPYYLCEMKGAGKECVEELRSKNRHECGNAEGCAKTTKRVLAMTPEGQFTLDGSAICVYP